MELQPTLAPMLRKLRLWKELDAEDEAAVLALPHRVERMEAGRYLVREGDAPRHSCVLLSGFAHRHKIVASGARSISSVHMRGDMVDLHNAMLGLADHNVQTLTDAEVAFVAREDVRRIAFERPAVGMAMWYDTLVDGSIFREWIANVSRRDAAGRLAHLLCEFAVRLEVAELGDKFSFELPMSQEQLADATGLTSVHVNRTLKLLERDGSIHRRRRHVAIEDWDKIRRRADFRSAYLHLSREARERAF
jgi:CRP-like cAMP-binding protein